MEVQARAFTVRVYSKVPSSVGISSLCFFKLSMYNSIASFAIAIASSIVSPYVTQPARDGTIDNYYCITPSGSYLRKIL